MLTLKRFLLGAATLTLLGTATITPAQAFTLSFQSTDGKTGNITTQDSGIGLSTLSIPGFSGNVVWSPGMWLGNQWFQRSAMAGPQIPPFNVGNVQFVNHPPFNIINIPSVLATTSTSVSVSLFCHSESDCLGDSGGITLTKSYFDQVTNILYSWTEYSVGITVTAWQATSTSPLTTLPNSGSNSTSTPTESTNSVPEPSSVFALLLLGTGWFVKNLKTRSA